MAVPPGRSVVPMPQGSGVVPPLSSGAAAAAVIDNEDYMNQEPEGMFHTYSNQKELLEQVHCMCTWCHNVCHVHVQEYMYLSEYHIYMYM